MRALRTVLLWAGIGLGLAAQIGLSRELRPLHPVVEEMPFPPDDLAQKALALGDDQFLFRVETRWLQDVGDGGARMRPLRDYDYGRVVAWLDAVGRLDPRSDIAFQLGSTYFGAIGDQTAGPPRVALLADYFARAAMADPGRRWPWLVWAAVHIQHVVKDPALARRTADDLLALRDFPDVPFWLPLLAVPLLRTAGDPDRAIALEADPDMLTRLRRARESFEGKLPDIFRKTD